MIATDEATDTQSKAHRFAAEGVALNPHDDVNEKKSACFELFSISIVEGAQIIL